MDNLIGFTFKGIKTKINDYGIEKKVPVGLPKHSLINSTNFKDFINPDHKGHAIITGLISGITVIDFDNAKSYEDIISKYPELKSFKTIKTNNGFHIYCKYIENLISTTDAFISYPSIDIRNDGGIVFAPPTKYNLLDGKEVSYENLGGEILSIPQLVLLEIKPDKFKKIKEPKEPKIKEPKIKEPKIKEPKVAKPNLGGLIYIKNLLDESKLDFKAFSGSYDDWRDVGFIFKHTSIDAIDLFHRFSMINKNKYDKNATNNFWNSIKTHESGLTIETLKYWVRQDEFKDVVICKNDNEAGETIIEMLKDDMLYCDGRIYMKIENCWESDSELVRNLLIKFILNAEIAIDSKIGPIKCWKNFENANKVYKTICCCIETSVFDRTLFHTTTKHRVAFKNGVLDFKEKIFYNWNEINFPYYTTVIIKTDYVEIDDFEELVSLVFEPLFGDKTELAILYIARAVAGCIEDKNFATYMGNRNSGKGILYELLLVFGSYIMPFNIENIRDVTKGATTSRDLYWMLPLEFTRLAISQEVPEAGCILRSDLIKKICSGGDTLTARRNYDRKDTNFNVQCSIFCMGNYEITTHGDVNEHRLVFEGATTFKTQEQYDSLIASDTDNYTMKKFRIADRTIKTKCQSENWRNKLVGLLLNRFKDEPIRVLVDDIEDQEDMSPFAKLLESYKITQIESHLVLGTDIHDIYGKKVKAELKASGVDYVKCKKNEFRDKWVYAGLQTIEPEK
jgi:Primase C terminal 2 (PriCT-2)/Bifunctional DNA primase/polymerase, N-terminal/D5 N terminal like